MCTSLRRAMHFARKGVEATSFAFDHGVGDNALLVEDVGKISHDYSTALRVLEFLQDHGAVLICTQCDVSYVLYIKGLSQALHQRAVRKGLGLPWWTGGERYTEINRAAGND